MVFPLVMYGCESGTIKKAECQRIDAFQLWYCRQLLRVPWTARRSNQSLLKQINPEYPLEGLTLKLKLYYLATWCEEPTHWKRPGCWGRLRAGGEGSNRGWDGWMASSTQWTWVWANSGRQWSTGKPGMLQSMGLQRVRHDWVTEQQQYTILHRKISLYMLYTSFLCCFRPLITQWKRGQNSKLLYWNGYYKRQILFLTGVH